MANTNLPLGAFPGLSAFNIVSPAVAEIAVTFNAEGLQSLSGMPGPSIEWANVGSRVTPGMFEGKIPISLTPLLGYRKFNGKDRQYSQVAVTSVTVPNEPWDLNVEYDIRFDQSGNAQLVNYYGLQGLPATMVDQARALKADLLASLMMAGFTNAALGVTATALTYPQPGAPSGLPLFYSAHYSNPIDENSRTFQNLYLGAGKITAEGVLGTVLQNMQQVPHPTKLNMNLGIGVTDIVGPSHMRIPFQEMAIRTLSLQTTTSPGNIGAATSNIYTNEALMKAAQVISAAGMNPIRYWIAPQLDFHPYVVANAGKHMWFAISNERPGACWAEFMAPSKEFTPRITILGDGSEEARKTRKVRIISDLDAGVAAGLPHFVACYFETTPT